MSFKSMAQELKEMREGIGSSSKRGEGSAGIFREVGDHMNYQQEEEAEEEQLQQVCSGNLPPEILMDIIGRVEAIETTWPSRRQVVACASVCHSWREVTREVVKPIEQSGLITFPISLKQPGPRDSPIECFIERDPGTNTYRLYLGATPAEENVKLLLSARKFRRATCSEFVISLSANDFSRDSSSYVGKLRPNFLGTKFTVFDSQPPLDAALLSNNNHTTRRFHSKQVAPRVPAGNYNIANISYEINFLRTRGPRRMQCRMYSIPVSSIQEGGTAPTPIAYAQPLEYFSALSLEKQKEPIVDLSATSLGEPSIPVQTLGMPLILKNKSPRWQEQLQCWCLNFRGRVTVASIKNFQLVAAMDPSNRVPPNEQEKVVLQFGKTHQDTFTMDYQYPLSAFQAFAICLTSFDTKPACE